jgi:methionyl-tRNA synthetase
LKPRCITRDLKWGVEVPTEDEEMKGKVFYVWFDAPIGYLSITANFLNNDWEKWWKNPDNVKLYQFMGKDNVTFHTVIFPSTIIGTEKEYTKVFHLSTTEYLNYENKKFSKTHSTGVFGDSAKTTGIPSEVWRYYLLANRPEQADTDFKWDDFMAKNNNELLSNLGNFVNRVLKFTSKNFNMKVPKFTPTIELEKEEGKDHLNKFNDKDRELLNNTRKLVSEYINALDNVKIKEGLRIFMELSSLGNAYLQETAPWLIMKTDPVRGANILFLMMNFVRLVGCIAEPYMPSFSAKLYELISLKYDENAVRLLKDIFAIIENQEKFDDIFLNLVKSDSEILDPLPLFKESK